MGRLPSPEDIVNWLTEELQSLEGTGKLAGKTVLVTAGGTQENIDPVRYIGNRSSGKMGYAIAAAAVKEKARVILVSAPTSLEIPKGVEYIAVDSAESMQEVVNSNYESSDVVIMAAAVSDFRVANKAPQKIKKNGIYDFRARKESRYT